MSSEYRPYEILLPLRFNDGTPIPDEAIGQTLLELRERFGAVSSETQTIQGLWEQAQIYRDDLTRHLRGCTRYAAKPHILRRIQRNAQK